MNKRLEASLIYAIAYVIATILACLSFKYTFDTGSFLKDLFLADLVGSVSIYLGCILLNSFSLYDPYWSYQCNLISVYYLYKKRSNLDWRTILVFLLVNTWSIRLNSNLFLTGVEHKSYEDWRYSNFRKKFPVIVGWFVGFLTFILLPTFLVFFGCLPLYYIYESNTNLNQLDLAATILTLIGIIFESIGDYQLRNEHAKNRNKRTVMDKGLWSLCRHPNYFGEITYWFGLLLFGITAQTQEFDAKLLIGPLGIFIIIYFGSLPMMEERQLERRKDYKEYIRRVPFKLFPANIFKYKTQ